MPSWWGKRSNTSKEERKKPGDETILDTIRRKLKNPSDTKLESSSGASHRHCIDTVSERGAHSRAESRSPSPKNSKHVGRCQSFSERPHVQPLPLPLPLPGLHPSSVSRTDSRIGLSSKPRIGKSSKSSLFIPLRNPSCIKSRADPAELDGDLVTASVSSDSSVESDYLTESQLGSLQASKLDIGMRISAGSPSSAILKDRTSKVTQNDSIETQRSVSVPISKQNTSVSARKRHLGNHLPNVQVPALGAFFRAPDSSMSSPSRSLTRTTNSEQVLKPNFWASKPYADVTLLGSGHCSSPGSGYNSGHNSMRGDISGHIFWQQSSRGSPEYSPIPSPRMTSPGPSSRVQSGAVTPIHPRAVGSGSKEHANWGGNGKQQSHRLPLPPVSIPSPSPFSHGNSAAASPSVPTSPSRGENLPSPPSGWKKEKLIDTGSFGRVYIKFNSEAGKMCAMKEVMLISDYPKSKESVKQLQQEISLLSRLQHPNIVQYYGSEIVGKRFCAYLEYVCGGSIYKCLQDYGQLGEHTIRSYTQQILFGLVYLHERDIVHRDIKCANILVDCRGHVKLANFGVATHIAEPSCPLSFKESPYWMAPEVIKNTTGCNHAVDIWSLGCTVLEMATTKPPWSQYEGLAAMFKIGNSKELPAIPDHLSDEGKDFVRLCLQRNPQQRHTAAELLEHPFVKNTGPVGRPLPSLEPPDAPFSVPSGMRTSGVGLERNLSNLDSERLVVHSSKVSPSRLRSSEYHIPRNISCPVSPIGSSHPISPQHRSGVMSPSPISSPRTTSGSSTPLSDSGAIPFHHPQQSLYMQECFRALPKSPNSVFLNKPCYQDPGPNILREIHSRPRPITTLVNSESEMHIKQVKEQRSCRVEDPYNRRAVLADRVS